MAGFLHACCLPICREVVVDQVAQRQSPVTESFLERVASGEPAAVEAVVDRYGALVWSIARRMSADPHDAEDAVQDIFADLWSNAARFDASIASETTFVSMIARRRLIDRRRRKGREPATKALPEFDITGGVDRSFDSVDLQDEVRIAKENLARLRPDQQRALELSIYQGCSHQEISEQLSLPLGTVKSHIRRGLTQIREAMARRNEP
ncbi:MAG: sigma-70 family RNA polymerase sigma factor [Planctomycetes bacterium]|nr:sigma-70 family RNA polymerase sigma factor [Planctomycetota bacterium]